MAELRVQWVPEGYPGAGGFALQVVIDAPGRLDPAVGELLVSPGELYQLGTDFRRMAAQAMADQLDP